MAYSAYDGSDRKFLALAKEAETKQVNALLNANPIARRDKQLIVNAGIAKEAYFRNFGTKSDGYWDALGMNNPANIPQPSGNASALWTGSSSSKGMFATSRYLSDTSAGDAGQLSAAQQLAEYERYGFYFHYNPTTVQMGYAGIPDIDYTMFTSGREAFNLLGVQATQSTVSFNLVLNRINDMKYFTDYSGKFDSTVKSSDWAGRFPTSGEQRDIYNKGTMYDIEFLLRTVMQVPIKSFLTKRNASWDGKTADIGFLTGVPVELHLGKSLRYLVRVDALSLDHVIFNERMVPIFTNVSVNCSRIPDYAADTSATYSASQPPTTKKPNKPGSSRPGQYNSNPNGDSSSITRKYLNY